MYSWLPAFPVMSHPYRLLVILGKIPPATGARPSSSNGFAVVRRQLRRLENLGFIKTERGKAPGGGNLYTILFPWRKGGEAGCPPNLS